jgi:hypothetical protein
LHRVKGAFDLQQLIFDGIHGRIGRSCFWICDSSVNLFRCRFERACLFNALSSLFFLQSKAKRIALAFCGVFSASRFELFKIGVTVSRMDVPVCVGVSGPRQWQITGLKPSRALFGTGSGCSVATSRSLLARRSASLIMPSSLSTGFAEHGLNVNFLDLSTPIWL